FRVLITAEATATPSRRSGLLVMRGTSPSARRLAHRDVLSPASPGQQRGDASATSDEHAAHAAHGAVPPTSSEAAWRMPPMGNLPMMPGMSALRPSAEPY